MPRANARRLLLPRTASVRAATDSGRPGPPADRRERQVAGDAAQEHADEPSAGSACSRRRAAGRASGGCGGRPRRRGRACADERHDRPVRGRCAVAWTALILVMLGRSGRAAGKRAVETKGARPPFGPTPGGPAARMMPLSIGRPGPSRTRHPSPAEAPATTPVHRWTWRAGMFWSGDRTSRGPAVRRGRRAQRKDVFRVDGGKLPVTPRGLSTPR